MDNQERARRFMMARTELNRNGSETKMQVYAETGVSASALSNLENPERNRIPSGKSISLLADHYGVNAAWLTGQSDSWSLHEDTQGLTDAIGLSPRAAEKLTCMMADKQTRWAINQLIESPRFDRMITAISRLGGALEEENEDVRKDGIVDFDAAFQQYGGKNESQPLTLAEGDYRDMLQWRAEREMEELIRETISGTRR